MRLHKIFLATFLFSLGSASAAVVVDPWVPIFNGIEFARGHADTNEPRLQEVQALRVDLSNPYIELFSTPSNGSAPLETYGQTTSAFVLTYGVKVAVNANFFSPVSTTPNEPRELTGLAISQGTIVSPAESGREMLLVTRSNVASIAASVSNPSNYWTAVAGSDRVLINGVKPTFPVTDFMTNGHPRTAVGISQNGRYLILMTIDGRRPGYSDGAPMTSVADWLLRLGAYNGLNLDGGGSTAMVQAESGSVRVLNRPSGNTQRVNGNHLGVFAPPLPPMILTAPTNQTILTGQNVAFSVFAGGTTPLRYQWRFQGGNISGATTSTLNLTNVQSAKAGTYTVVITNESGSITSSPVSLAVHYSLNTPNVSGGTVYRSPSQLTYPPNSTVTLNAIANPGFVFKGWSGDVSTTNNPLTLTMNAHKNIGAQFVGPPNDIIIDNTHAEFSGTWLVGTTAAGRYGPDYHFVDTVSGNATASAIYRPNITRPGKYDIYLWYPQGSNRSGNSPWQINSAEGSQTVFVNQQVPGGNWRWIASKTFAQGTNGFIRVSNNASPSVVIADAVRFALNPSPPQLFSPRIIQNELRFSSLAFTGFTYTVESSSNLTNWLHVTNVFHSSEILEILVPTTNPAPNFFRLRWTP